MKPTKQLGQSEFRTKLASIDTPQKYIRETLQELLLDAFMQATPVKDGGHGSCNKLDQIVNALAGMKSLPTRVIQRYITEHCRVSWGKLKDGRKGYTLVEGGGVTWPEVTWWEWHGNENAKAKDDVDVMKSIKLLISRAESAAKKGKTVEHSELLPDLKAMLKSA